MGGGIVSYPSDGPGPGGDRYIEANRRSWDARTPTHFKSRYYDVDGFRAGASSLNSLEIEEVGDVEGKSLLHLQCHFGMDTMSWARLGAVATGWTSLRRRSRRPAR